MCAAGSDIDRRTSATPLNAVCSFPVTRRTPRTRGAVKKPYGLRQCKTYKKDVQCPNFPIGCRAVIFIFLIIIALEAVNIRHRGTEAAQMRDVIVSHGIAVSLVQTLLKKGQAPEALRECTADLRTVLIYCASNKIDSDFGRGLVTVTRTDMDQLEFTEEERRIFEAYLDWLDKRSYGQAKRWWNLHR